MSDFLKKLQAELTGAGIPVEIAGESLVVVSPSESDFKAFHLESEREARRILRADEKELRAEKLNKKERDAAIAEVRSILEAAAGGDKDRLAEVKREFQTQYDTEFWRAYLVQFSRAITANAVRYPDGTPLSSDPAERKQIADAMLALPGAESKINQALQEAAQKKSRKSKPKPS